MRIIAGAFRGRRLAALGAGDTAAHLRPTPDRVRESLFNVLGSGVFGDPLTDAHVLDLFAGTGALGLEALSRGAAHATFVDNGRKAARLISENIAITGTKASVRLIQGEASKLPKANGTPATLVFLDPPYGLSLGASALLAAKRSGWIAPDALVVWEENAPMAPPEGFSLLDQRRYGDTHITFLQASDQTL